MAETHIGSDYFSLIIVVKVPLVVKSRNFSKKKMVTNSKEKEISFPLVDILICD